MGEGADLNRLRHASAPVVTYDYDAQGRRVVRAVDGVVDTRWVYGGGTAPIAELDGAGAVRRRYAFVGGLFTPTVAGHVSGATRYLVDHLGRPRVAVHAALGTVEMEVATDSFGRVTSGSAVARFGMGGGVWDPDTGLLHLGARDYTPELGRWLAPDPAGFGGGQANLYAYVGSNPISYVDPSGEVGVVVVIVFGVGILASIALNPNSAGDASPPGDQGYGDMVGEMVAGGALGAVCGAIVGKVASAVGKAGSRMAARWASKISVQVRAPGVPTQIRPNGAIHHILDAGRTLVVSENHFGDILKVFGRYNGRWNVFSRSFWQHVLPHRHVYRLGTAPSSLHANWRKTFGKLGASKTTIWPWE